jgi:hypothetical protein
MRIVVTHALGEKLQACFDQSTFTWKEIAMFVSRFLRFCAVLVVLLASGCTSYYRITDQSTRRTYFATGYDTTSSGAVQFYDEKSRVAVTLQSSEVVEISRDEFDSGLKQ